MTKTKIVYNACYGGFGLSDAACQWLAERGLLVRCVEYSDPETYEQVTADWRGENGEEPRKFSYWRYWHEGYSERDIPRHHPLLVQVVEEMGEAADGPHADLRVEEIEGNKYRIREYGGNEYVETPGSVAWIDASR